MRNRNITSKTRSIALVGALITGLVAPAVATSGVAHAAATTVSAATTKYFIAEATTSIKGISVSGLEGKNVLASISVPATSGSLSLSVTTGLTLSFGYTSFTGSELTFVGSQSAVNTALGSLTFTSSKTDTSQTMVLKTMFTESKDGLAYFPANRHFYRFVAGKISPKDAAVAAAATKEFSLTGYLATITSFDENNFVSSKLEGAKNVVINGSDADKEETWKFVGGPEDGQVFYQGCGVTSTSTGTSNGKFVYWNPEGEPNNWISQQNKCGGTAYNPTAAAGEDCVVTNWNGASVAAQYRGGYWNDFECTSTRGDQTDIGGFVVEYGNSTNGSTFDDSVAFRENTLARKVPTQQLAPAQKLVNAVFNGLTKLSKNFKLFFTKPAKSAAPVKKELCPKVGRLTRLNYTLTFNEPGRYAFYFTNKVGKRIPMQCGSRIKTRVITEPISSPVIQSVKPNETAQIGAYLLSSSVGSDANYPLMNVILKRTDGTLVRIDQPIPPLPGGANAAMGVYGVKPTK